MTTETNVVPFEVAETSFLTEAISVKDASKRMHSALVSIVAAAIESGKHSLIHQTMKKANDNLTVNYRSQIVLWLNEMVEGIKAEILDDGSISINANRTFKKGIKNFASESSDYLTTLFAVPFYDVGKAKADKPTGKVWDAQVELSVWIDKAEKMAAMNEDQMSEKGYSYIDSGIIDLVRKLKELESFTYQDKDARKVTKASLKEADKLVEPEVPVMAPTVTVMSMVVGSQAALITMLETCTDDELQDIYERAVGMGECKIGTYDALPALMEKIQSAMDARPNFQE